MSQMNEKIQEPQEQPSDRPPLREISDEELQKVLVAHREWVESEGKEGEKADLRRTRLSKSDLCGAELSRADLSEADLSGANLSQANLTGAFLWATNLSGASLVDANLSRAMLGGANLSGPTNLWKANFFEANLDMANLSGAFLSGAKLIAARLATCDLSRANLYQADLSEALLVGANLAGASLNRASLRGAQLQKSTLRDTDLHDADLTEATGLLTGQLAGANVVGAKLPRDIQEFHGLRIVAETSENARKVFFSMLLACAYSWLTIATTTDARLLTNSSSSPLPLIGTSVPIVGFYWAAPLTLVCLYFYFHLYLQRLWEGLADLPAVFPDGTSLHKQAYPWLLTGLVCAHFKRLRENRPSLSRLQNAISILLAWWVVPFTLILIWGRYLIRHDWWGTGLHIGLIAISAGFWIISQRLARLTLRGKEKSQYFWTEALKDVRTYKRAALTLGTLGIGIIFYLVSYGAIDGVPERLASSLRANDLRRLVPYTFALIGYSPFADLQEADVSTKPADWKGQTDQIPLVRGAILQGRDLRYANARGAFLVNADLRRANLEGANLAEADLQGADLRDASLLGANLLGAKLQKARFLHFTVMVAKNWKLVFYSKDALELLDLPLDHNKRLPLELLAVRLEETVKKVREYSPKPLP